MTTRPNALFGPSSWTGPFSTASSNASARRSGSRSSPPRCRRAPASRSRCCRSSWRPSTTSLQRGLVVLLPEDADARDAAEAAGWFLGDENVALFPSRGVHWGSGLEPPPHLVGERARALAVLERGGLVCASATAVAEGVPPAGERPAVADASRRGDEPGSTLLAEQLASAGYERVERVEERGQFAVRGGLVDVFATTGREPLRIEFFGDEIEQIRAFSPFTQRALRQSSRRRSIPPPSGGASSSRSTSARRGRGAPALEAPDDLVQAFDRPPDFVWSLDEVQAVWAEEGLAADRARPGDRADPAAAGPAAFVRRAAARARRARAVRGRERAGRAAAPGARRRRRRSRTAARRSASRRSCVACRPSCSTRASTPSGLQFAVSPARRGFVWRELGFALLPDTQVFRKRPPRASSCAGPRAAELLRPAHRRLRRARGPRHRAAARLRDEGGRRRHARLPPARLPRRRPRLRPARADRQGQPLHRRRLEGADALEARRQGLGQPEDARARASPRDGRRAAAAVRAAADAAGDRLRRRARVGRTARERVPVPRDGGPAHRDRGGQGGPRVAAPDGPARLRRRRLRQDRGRVARRVRRRGERQAGADARADDRARAAALEHLQGPLSRLSRPRRDGLALPDAAPR